MIKVSMFMLLKRFLASSSIFWKYRHIIQRNFFLKSYGGTFKNHYDLIFKKTKFKSVLDYGCATGDKLVYFIKRGAKNVYGIDINFQAIQASKKNVQIYSKVNYKFNQKLIICELKKFLNGRKFDLIIFDRVLYILNDLEFYKVIYKLSKFTRYIFINDFYLNDTLKKNLRKKINGYIHSNFVYILKKKGFGVLPTHYSTRKKPLFTNARAVLFVYRD